MAQPQPTPPGSSASSTSSCEGNYYGQFTLIQFIQEIENEARSNVHSLLTGNRALVIYHSSSPNPQTINLLVDAAVAYCEQEEAADAINRTNVNRQHERRRVSPKKAERGPQNTIYFNVVFADGRGYYVSWRP